MKDNKEEKQFYIFSDGNFGEIKWLTGTKYLFELSNSFNEHAQLKRWCEENCEDVIVYYENKNTYDIPDEIYFYSETDDAAFKLRWT